MKCHSKAEKPPMLLCDCADCDNAAHITCLKLPLKEVPKGPWACPCCVDAAPTCNVCDVAAPCFTRAPPLKCTSCKLHFHRECLGLHNTSCIAGEFVCAPCTLLAAKVAAPTERALEAANTLVYLKANRAKGSSQDAYASALHHYTHFVTKVLGLSVKEALPPGPNGTIPTSVIELFLAYASKKYKHSTIKLTLDAM